MSLYSSLVLYCLPVSFILASECGKDQFRCLSKSKTKCFPNSWKCDGRKHCDNALDELASECQNCSSFGLFRCVRNGIDRCAPEKYKCDGTAHCDDYSDELASECKNCTDSGLFRCVLYGIDICVTDKCDGVSYCDDY